MGKSGWRNESRGWIGGLGRRTSTLQVGFQTSRKYNMTQILTSKRTDTSRELEESGRMQWTRQSVGRDSVVLPDKKS